MSYPRKPGVDCTLSPVDADFLFARITENLSRIGDTPGPGFLNPLAHLILVLIKSITTKDVTARKSLRRGAHQLYACREVTGVFGPPGGGQDVTGIVYPLRTGNVISLAEKID